MQQYSFAGDKVEEVDIVRSFFTNALVQGLENGEADLDRDGRISFDELYHYVYRYVKEKIPKQTPRKWALGVEGDTFIARTPSKLF
jgi:uncharacterized caspase-like protein